MPSRDNTFPKSERGEEDREGVGPNGGHAQQHTHIHTHTYTHTYIHTYIHTHIHTDYKHTQSLTPPPHGVVCLTVKSLPVVYLLCLRIGWCVIMQLDPTREEVPHQLCSEYCSQQRRGTTGGEGDTY